MMTRRKIVVIACVCAVVAAAGAVCFWQWSNIAALVSYVTYDKSEIANKIEKSKNETNSQVEKYAPSTVRELTKEEEEQIKQGKLSVEEAADRIYKAPPNVDKTAPGNESQSSKNSEADPAKQAEIVGRQVAKLYAYKAYYLGELDKILKGAVAEYNALPNEKKTEAEKKNILREKMGQAAGLEEQCDAKVASILDELKKELSAIGGNLEIINVLNSAYENEKSLQKAYYLSLLKK